MNPTVCVLLITCLVLAGLSGAAGTAGAASYNVFSCHGDQGEPIGIDGWVATARGSFVAANSNCDAGNVGALNARILRDVDHPGGDIAAWTFAAPPDTRIMSFGAVRSVEVGPYRDFGVPQYLLYGDATILEYCNRVGGCNGLTGGVEVAVNAAQSVHFETACSGDAGCQARTDPMADAFFSRTRVELSDNSAPVVSDVGGDLATATSVSGKSSLTFNASDKGGGLARVRVYVDDRLHADTAFDDNAGRCRQPYSFAVPCKASGIGTATLDTTSFADGATFTLRVEVVDAAGNATLAIPPRKVTADNVPPCLRQAAIDAGRFIGGVACNPDLVKDGTTSNGTPATPGAILSAAFARQVPTRCKSARDRSRGKRCTRSVATTVTRADARDQLLLRGTLTTAANEPVRGARVWIAKTNEGGAPRMLTALTTKENGTFSGRLPADQPSGAFRVYYFPFGGKNDAVTTKGELRVRVRAGVSLTAKRSSSRRVSFKGSVLGPFGPNGVAVALQVREGGGWRTFRQLRARGAARATFSAAFRFKGRPAARTYRFRAVVIRQSGLPFDTGRSPARSVRLR